MSAPLASWRIVYGRAEQYQLSLLRGAVAQKKMPKKTKNRTTSRTTRLSTSAEIFHWKMAAPAKNSASRTPRIGKIYKMLKRDAGVEGRGALLTYSISDSSGSIEHLST